MSNNSPTPPSPAPGGNNNNNIAPLPPSELPQRISSPPPLISKHAFSVPPLQIVVASNANKGASAVLQSLPASSGGGSNSSNSALPSFFSSSSSALFSISSLENNTILFPSVFLNNKPVSERFLITNVQDFSSVRMGLSSDLGNQMTFQLGGGGGGSGGIATIASSTMTTNNNSNNNTSNTTTNTVEEVEKNLKFLLKPRETREVIVNFCPEAQAVEETMTTPNKEANRHLFFPIMGNIFVQGECLESALSSPVTATTAMTATSSSSSSTGSGVFGTASPGATTMLSPAARQEQVVIVYAQVCRSVLEVDVHQLQQLDDCVPNDKYVRDFTVWNRSEVPLTFGLSAKHSKGCTIEFTKYDTGAPSERFFFFFFF